MAFRNTPFASSASLDLASPKSPNLKVTTLSFEGHFIRDEPRHYVTGMNITMNKLLDVHEVGCLQQASCNSLNPTSTIEPVSPDQIRQRLVTPFGNKVIGARCTRTRHICV